MKSVGISEFKAHCIEILKNLQAPLIITHRGEPVARIEPLGDRRPKRTLGALRHLGRINSDLVDKGFATEWDMEQQ